jgi:hypothetical protein
MVRITYAPAQRLRLTALGASGHVSRLGLVTYGVTQIILLLWWIALYPGLLSYDSVMYVWQATTGNWSTSHSVVYNALLWLSLQSSGEVAPLTFIQTVAMASGLAYAVTGLRAFGVRGRWLAVSAIAAVCLPVVGTFTVYISKDVAFVLCEVWLLGTVARLAASGGALMASPSEREERAPASTAACSRSLAEERKRGAAIGRWLWALFAELALITLFRPNGFLVATVTVTGLAAVLGGLRWRVVAFGAGAVVVGLLATNVVFPAIGVRRAGSELVLGPAYADLAVALDQRPSAFHPSDLALLSTVAPLSYWRTTANCYNADSTVAFGRPQFSIDAARAHQRELFDLWLRVLQRAPDVVIQARICRGSIAWNPFPGPAQGWTVKIPIGGVSTLFNFPPQQIAQSPYAAAIHRAPLSHVVNKVAVFAREVSDTRSFEWLAWRGSTWSYVAYLAVGLFAWRRRDWRPVALVAIVAATQITVAVNNPGQLVRYMVGPVVVGILLLPFAFAKRPATSQPTGDSVPPDGHDTT